MGGIGFNHGVIDGVGAFDEGMPAHNRHLKPSESRIALLAVVIGVKAFSHGAPPAGCKSTHASGVRVLDIEGKRDGCRAG
jgi:hypothetical protein